MTFGPGAPTAEVLWTAKSGNTVGEWEDGFAISERRRLFTVADGASTSAHAREWAGLLTAAMVTDPINLAVSTQLGSWLSRRCQEFAGQQTQLVADDVAWYASEVSNRDAFATLLTINIERDRTTAHCLAIGDCDMFVIAEGSRLSAAWPVSESDSFGSAPELVSSNPERIQHTLNHAQRCRVDLTNASHIILASDAISEWALGVADAEPDVWKTLLDVDSDNFERLVSDLRTGNEIVNDDVTVVRIELHPDARSNSLSPTQQD